MPSPLSSPDHLDRFSHLPGPLPAWVRREKNPPLRHFKGDSAPVQRPVTLPEFVTNAPAAHKAMTLKVPLILQKDNYSSGPTSLAMVMGYYDVLPYDKKEVWKRSGTTFKQVLRECGNDMAGLERAARSYGFSHMEFMENANLETIKSLLDQGIAPIANVRSFHSEKPGHPTPAWSSPDIRHPLF